jgi:hypothetical protein
MKDVSAYPREYPKLKTNASEPRAEHKMTTAVSSIIFLL